MSQASANTPRTARTWRDIQQEVAPRSMSREGKKRYWLASVRLGLGLTLLGVVGWGGYEVWKTTRTTPVELVPGTVSQGVPLKEIVLKTDGVLDLAHVEAQLAIPPKTPLVSLDLNALHEALLAGGQVRTAVLARRFPDKLAVTLEERTPVLRVVVRGADGHPEALYVARDGVVYSGSGYDPALTASLPYLDGVRLVRDGDGYQPVRGMESVADLLGTALAATPGLYRDFHVVSLARFASDGEIIVRSAQVESVTFGTREDFYRQLSKLDLILDEMRRPSGSAPIKAINLAVGGRQVPVSLADASPAPTTTRQTGTTGFFRPSQPANPASRPRDF